MFRATTWENQGVSVRRVQNVYDALVKAGLAYNVVKKDIFLADGTKVVGTQATVVEGTNRILGTVSSNYGVVQNEEAFKLADSLVESGFKFEKAGETSKGKIWLIGSLPAEKVLDDKIKPYVILQNSHNGICSLRAAISPLRVVCQNQFSYAFKNTQNVVSLKHSLNVNENLHEARRILVASENYMESMGDFAEEMFSKKVNDKQVKQILSQLFAVREEDTEGKKARMQRRAEEVFNIYKNTDDLANYSGTGYGLVQAYSDFVTHGDAQKKTKNWEESRFVKVTFEPNALNKLVEIVREAA